MYRKTLLLPMKVHSRSFFLSRFHRLTCTSQRKYSGIHEEVSRVQSTLPLSCLHPLLSGVPHTRRLFCNSLLQPVCLSARCCKGTCSRQEYRKHQPLLAPSEESLPVLFFRQHEQFQGILLSRSGTRQQLKRFLLFSQAHYLKHRKSLVLPSRTGICQSAPVWFCRTIV